MQPGEFDALLLGRVELTKRLLEPNLSRKEISFDCFDITPSSIIAGGLLTSHLCPKFQICAATSLRRLPLSLVLLAMDPWVDMMLADFHLHGIGESPVSKLELFEATETEQHLTTACHSRLPSSRILVCGPHESCL